MLVLSRKSGEKIHVGDDVVIEIKRVTGSRVTIAIEAPREVRILRGELKVAAKQFEQPAEGASSDASRSAAPIAPLETYLVSHERVNPADIVPLPPVIG